MPAVPTPSYIPAPLAATHPRRTWVRGTRLTSVHPPPRQSPIIFPSRACRTPPCADKPDDDRANDAHSYTTPVQNAVRRHLSRKAPLHATMDSYLQCVECYALYIVEPEELDNAPRVVGCSNCLHEWYATEADLLWGEEEALEALAKRHVKDRGDRHLPTVQDPVSDGGVNIFVGNLSFRATIDDLHRAFGGYGEVVRCQIPSDPSGASRGYGFVEMKRRKEGLAAMRKLQGVSILGRDVALMEARQREATDFERRKRKEDGEPRARGRAQDSEQRKKGNDEATANTVVGDPLANTDSDKHLSKPAGKGGSAHRQEGIKAITENKRWKVGDSDDTRNSVNAIVGRRDDRKAGRAGGGRSKRSMGIRTARRQKETSESGRGPAGSKTG